MEAISVRRGSRSTLIGPLVQSQWFDQSAGSGRTGPGVVDGAASNMSAPSRRLNGRPRLARNEQSRSSQHACSRWRARRRESAGSVEAGGRRRTQPPSAHLIWFDTASHFRRSPGSFASIASPRTVAVGAGTGHRIVHDQCSRRHHPGDRLPAELHAHLGRRDEKGRRVRSRRRSRPRRAGDQGNGRHGGADPAHARARRPCLRRRRVAPAARRAGRGTASRRPVPARAVDRDGRGLRPRARRPQPRARQVLRGRRAGHCRGA